MNYHVILNPAAGRGKAGKQKEAILNTLRSVLGEVSYTETTATGEARSAAEELKNNNTVVIAVGGDGTVHEVINGLVGGESSLAVVPIGSGNDFVKMLNLPLKASEAINVIKENRRKEVDLGKVNNTWFANGLGIGFDADVVVQANKIRWLRGFFIYLLAVLRTLRQFKNRPVRIKYSGYDLQKDVFMISVGNGECQGGGFFLTPGAKVDDGLLDFCIFDALKSRQILGNLIKVLLGTHIHLPQVNLVQSKKMIIESDSGIPLHADGEMVDHSAKLLEITVHPKALTVIHNIQT